MRLGHTRQVLLHLLVGCVVGLACGLSCALFLSLLEQVSAWRAQHPQILFALPLAGLALGGVWQRVGAPIAAGADTILARLHDLGPTLPKRMAPMVLLGTLTSHLIGATVGREGTAVQMGAALADRLHRGLRLPSTARAWTLSAGVAGGFGAAFGAPLAGALFALEWAVVGQLRSEAMLPLLVAALVGNAVVRALLVDHGAWRQVASPPPLTATLLGKWLLVAAALALCGVCFVQLIQLLRRGAARAHVSTPLRLGLGGAVFLLFWQLLGGGTTYLGLGQATLHAALSTPHLGAEVWACKLLLTCICLGSGFIGGEVTPLLFIGAALGNALAQPLQLPVDLAAGVGMVGLLAGVTHTPVALTVMAMELLGASVGPHALLVCLLCSALTGRHGIYHGQRFL